jgi:hypothetical protein
MWVKWRTCSAALLALGLAGACGKSESTVSGETHFVKCDVDEDCSGLSNVPKCGGGYCRDAQGNKLPAPGSGSNNNSSGNDDGPAACASSCGGGECAAPGTCTLSSACKVVNCDNAVVDAEACIRPSCESDQDCPDDERCLSGWRSREYDCKQSGNSCECTAGLGLFPLHVCSPTQLAGVRGTWQKLYMKETVIGQPTEHTLLPDGSVTIVGTDAMGKPFTHMQQLSAADLEELERYVNGAELRLELDKPHECELTKATDLDIQLELDTETLQQGVAGCTLGDSPVPVFRSVYDLVNRYN